MFDAPSPQSMPSRLSRASVQTHSEDSIGDGGAMLTSKTLSHRRRPVPMAELGPGLPPGRQRGGIALNDPNAPKYQILNRDLVTGWLPASAAERAARRGASA